MLPLKREINWITKLIILAAPMSESAEARIRIISYVMGST